MWDKAPPTIDARPIASLIAKKCIAVIETCLNEIQNIIKARLDEIQSNFNTCQKEVTSMLDRILATDATIRSAGSITGINSAGTSTKNTLN